MKEKRMKSINIILLLLGVLLISGCIEEPTFKGNIPLSKHQDEKFSLIYNQSKKCFEKDWSAFSDGVKVVANKYSRSKEITFHRFSLDISGLTEPFITLKFQNNQIEVIEGTYECSFNGCVEFDIKQEIENWLSGNKTCIYKQY